MKELCFEIEGISDKEADDLATEIVAWLQNMDYVVGTYYVSIRDE